MLRGPALVIGARRGIGAALAKVLAAERGAAPVIGTCRNRADGPVGTGAGAGTGTGTGTAKTQAGSVQLISGVDVTASGSDHGLETALRALEEPPRTVIICAGKLAAADSDSSRHPESESGSAAAKSRRNKGPERSIKECSAADMLEVAHTNAIGPFLMAQRLLPFFAASKGGSSGGGGGGGGEEDVVRLAVLSARVGSIGDNRLGGWYSYRASKAMLNQLFRTLSVEAKRTHKNLIITLVHPGTVATDLSAPFVKATSKGVFSPEDSARKILDTLAQQKLEDSGSFVDYANEKIQW